MNIDELKSLIAQGEGETLEWKETTGQRGDACETLCAFLNRDGGTVVFGVSRKSKVTGQLISDKTKRELFEVFEKFEPSADIATEWIPVDETHQAIVCTVERGNGRPYVYDGRPHKRVQSSTTVMTREEYNRMLEERRGFESPWEAMPNPKLKLEDIDLDEVRRTAQKAVQMGRLDSSVNTEDAVGLLDHFKLRENGVLLNGAAVLFGNDKSIWYPQLEIKMGWFRGTTDREFLDNRHVSGNVFKLMDEAMAFCFKHLNLSAKISGKIERDEELEIPAAALRETLVNAFAHRDYDDSRTVYLAVYSDRVEIKSPGGFPATLSLDRLYDPPVRDSRPRNPRIAHVMYLCKMIETWGRGIGVIAGECERVGLPLPQTAKCGGSVVTTFIRPKVDGLSSDLDQNLDRRDPDPIQIDPDPSAEFTRKLLQTIRRNPLISRKLIAVELDASERKIRESLKILKESGVIVRQGPDHGGIWRISRIVQKPAGADNVFGVEKHGSDDGNHEDNADNREVKKEDNEGLIVRELSANPKVSVRVLAERLPISKATIERALKSLQESGCIRRVGGTRGMWEVVS